MRRYLACWLVVLLLLFLPQAILTARAERLLQPASSNPVDEAYFGLHVQRLLVPHDTGSYSRWPDIPFGSWRLWGAYVAWHDLQPQRNIWRFDRLDRYVSIAAQRGVSVMLTLGFTPRWASARPDEPCAFGTLGCSAEPANLADWDAYVRTVATRYKGRIQTYELWNEPRFSDLDPVPSGQRAGFFSGSTEMLVQMSLRASRIIREVDPAARIALPAFDGGARAALKLDRFLAMGGKAAGDIVSVHLYAATPEAMVQTVDAVRTVMRKHGIEKLPLWNTEVGFAFERPYLDIAPGPDTRSFRTVLAADVGAAYVARTLLLNRALGIERIYWFEWDADRPPLLPMGLADHAGQSAGLPGLAYARVSVWMRGAIVEACSLDDQNLWTCTLNHGGVRSHVLWRESGSLSFDVPVSWGGKLAALSGTSQPLPSNRRITVGISPVRVYP